MDFALMSCVAIIAVLVSSRLSIAPVLTIRWCAFLMVIAVMVSFFSPLGFALLGVLCRYCHDRPDDISCTGQASSGV